MRKTHKYKLRELMIWFDERMAKILAVRLTIEEAEMLCEAMTKKFGRDLAANCPSPIPPQNVSSTSPPRT